MNSIEKLKNTRDAALTLAISFVVFTLSSLYAQNGYIKLNVTLFPQIVVFVIFGFLHAYNVWTFEISAGSSGGVGMLTGYFFMYSAWYNVILLSESGIGYVEWFIVLLVLGSSFFNQLFSRPFRMPQLNTQRPLVLIFFGIMLFLIKIFLYHLFSDNIYDSTFLINDTARFIVFVFSILGAAVLLIQLIRFARHRLNMDIPPKNSALSFAQRACFTVLAAVKAFIRLLGTLVSGPYVILILAVAGLLIFGISFFVANKIYRDVLLLVEPILERLLSTGKNSVYPSIFYYTCQLVCVSIILLYSAVRETQVQKTALSS